MRKNPRPGKMAYSTGGVIVKYVRHKVSVVRWRPTSQGSLQEPDVFVTGSWDNGSNNKLSLWQFVQDDLSSGKHEIRQLCDAKVNFSITDIKFLSRTDDGLVLSCEDGSVMLYRCDRRQEGLVPSQHWDLLHAINGRRSSCTSVSVSHDGSIVSSGEDNKICHLSVDSATPLRIIEDADVCGINAVTFSQLAEVLSVSSVGHLKVWDLRNTANNKPVKTMKMSGDIEGLHCVQCHPTHPHLVVTGRSDGSVCFWDLRHHRQPLSHMVAHTDIVWDVHFHPSYPKHLFTCSNDGCLWHWDATKVTSSTTPRDSAITPWLTGDVLANGMDVINTIPHNVLPINSLDVFSRHLIAGADNEAIYVIPDVIDQ